MSKHKIKLILTGLLVIIAIGMKLYESANPKEGENYTKRTDPKEVTKKGDGKQGKYFVLRDCQYIPDRYNDGDSFKIKTPDGRVVEVRLYFVDAPESRDKPYANHRKRVGKQGDYFGGLSYQKTLKLGEKAKKFAASSLKGKKLTVYTVWKEVFDSGRFYAFVEVEGQGFWHEMLTRKGLSRIYTEGAEMPNGTSRRKRESQLRKLEAKARKSEAGGWGM